MVFYYPLEYNLMEITDSLATDIKDAPDWFHSAISQSPRKKTSIIRLVMLPIKSGIGKMLKTLLFLFMGQALISNGGTQLHHFYVTNFL